MRSDAPPAIGKDGRYALSRDRKFLPPPRKRPVWWAEALQLWIGSDLTHAQVAEKLGKRPDTVARALNSPWARERRMDIERRTRERLVEAGVSPILQAQLEAPAAMGRIVAASRAATKPMEVAAINKDVLAIAGYVTDRRQSSNVTVSLQGKIRDVSDAELEAFATRGVVPESLGGLLALPAPEDVPGA